ncbi:MAG TPA: hypothetical protein VLE94_21065 [Burkholderiaceae bacterium]|nr:hypothetical protein [Burkholderiaceae bacterium]HSC00889.1 hypothetical protein [Burkholderiaceae bacterium]
MKWLLSMALAFVSAGALACPADDVKDAQANVPDKPLAQAKAAPAKAVASSTKKAQPAKAVDKQPATVATAKPSL